MISLPLMTAEQFAERRHELADGGRWAELVRGVVVSLQPPEEAHGTVVLNLTKALAAHARTVASGYACFELGLIVSRSPDTVWQPAVCWFSEGERFAEVDKQVSEAVPALVVEIVSTNDRRRGLAERIAGWHAHGVRLVWVIDPIAQTVHVLPRGGAVSQHARQGTLRGEPVLEGFSISLPELFAEPEWWGGKKP